jgi:radical SAM protein (TIGR01212 family)
MARWRLAEPAERYRSFSRYLRERYGAKVWKIPVDAGFSCPNRDGTIGTGGCSYCRLESFSRLQSRLDIDVATQVETGIRAARQHQGVDKFIVYFQASSNTHAPVDVLRHLYGKAIDFAGVVGLDISTRPDCLSPEVLALLAEMARRTDLWVELGLQSIHDQTLQAIHRGHTYDDYLAAVTALQQLPLRICTHLILGLPGESVEMMHQTAAAIARSPIDEIKLHPLLVLKKTPLAGWYRSGRFKALALGEYAALAADFIERMPKERVIQRMTAEAPEAMLIAPRWVLDKHSVRRSIEEELIRRETWQGRLFHS